MKRLNTTLDREPMTSQEIRDRQDFNYILKEATAAKVPIWKSIWFYGPVGIAMVTMVVSAVRMNPKNEQFENNTTLSQFTATTNTDLSTNTIEVKKSEELTETKSNSNKENKENDAPILSETKVVNPSNTTTPETKTKADPSTVESALLVNTEGEPIEEKKVLIEEPIVEAKPAKTMPNIAGVFNGRIPISQICSTGQIDCNNGYEIIAFDIQYDDGTGSTTDHVRGNRIPSTICSKLNRYNIGGPVFITRIIAMNEKGERKQLLSMSIQPTF